MVAAMPRTPTCTFISLVFGIVHRQWRPYQRGKYKDVIEANSGLGVCSRPEAQACANDGERRKNGREGNKVCGGPAHGECCDGF